MLVSSMTELDTLCHSPRERSREKEREYEDIDNKPKKELGVISSLKDRFGFLKTTAGDKELFFHSSGMAVCGTFESLREGDEVSYEVGWDSRTEKEMAVDVEVRGVLKLCTNNSNCLRGVVVRLNSKGFGFIQPRGAELRIYFHSTNLVRGLRFDALREGDEVDYNEGFDEKAGKPQAENVKLCNGSNCVVDTLDHGREKEDGFKLGIVTKLNKKGFGFINSGSGEETYFHSTGMERSGTFHYLTVGEEVIYKMGWDKKNGKEMAVCVGARDRSERHIDGPSSRAEMNTRYGSFLSREEFGRDRQRPMFGGSQHPRSASRYDPFEARFDGLGPMGVLRGRVVSKTEKGFGFLEPVEGGEHIYFHSTSLQRPATFNEIGEGDEVSYVMGWDKKNGKKMANNVTLISKGSPGDETEGWLGKITGRISSLNQKGFGFITMGREDIYFHSTSLFRVNFNALMEGDDVVFTKGWDKKNRKEMATFVELRDKNRCLEDIMKSEEVRQEQNENPHPPVRSGKIFRLNNKGFGFIKQDDGKESIYFHSTGLATPDTFNQLKEGDSVVYEEKWDRINMKAMAIRVDLQ